MSAPLVPCSDHGPSEWCYDTAEGHVDSERCCCLWSHRSDCPVPEHRQAARAAPGLAEETR